MTAGSHEAVLTDIPNQASTTARRAIDFDRLVREEHARIRGLAWRFGVPASELDDAVQDIFMKAWGAHKRFRGEADPATWLTRIAVNHLTSRRRSIRTRLAALADWRPFQFGAPIQPDSAAASHEAEERAARCVSRLSPKLRAVFVLRYLEERSCAEIAELLSVPESTVRTRAFHARRRLREMMRGTDL